VVVVVNDDPDMNRDAAKRVCSLIQALEAASDGVPRYQSVSPALPAAEWVGNGEATDPLPQFTHAAELLAALRALLDGDAQPVQRWLGIVNPRPGLPGRTVEEQIRMLRRIREDRLAGMSRYRAAEKARINPGTLSRMERSHAGLVEAVLAKLDGLPPLKTSRRRRC